MSEFEKSGRKRKKYPADLEKPSFDPFFDHNGFGILHTIANRGATARQAEVMFRLLKHYKIDPEGSDCWLNLALALAVNHVPAMQTLPISQPRPGRKAKWPAGRYHDLLRDVGNLRKKFGISDMEALQRLHHDPTSGWSKDTIESLPTRLREARRAHKSSENVRIYEEEESAKKGEPFGPLRSTPSLDEK